MRKTYVVMGVTGCGKSTIGKLLASQLNIPFYDGDDFHPEANIKKMSNGSPLNDDDRMPWLQKLNKEIGKWNKHGGAVLACSSLKNTYRELLSTNNEVQFVYLKSTRKLIIDRLGQRENHFMPSSLIDSQFEALEEPKDAVIVNASLLTEEIVDLIKKEL